MSLSRPRISVVLNTRNEEANLANALASVASWTDEIVVVDMRSSDGTVAIAQRFGARVLEHEPVGFADPARKLAVREANGDWILILDADEVVPVTLAERLQAVARDDDADVIDIPYCNYFLGRPLRFTFIGSGNDRHIRFFRHGSLYTSGAIHDYVHPLPGARRKRLPQRPEFAIHHFGYLDLAHFAEKIDRYTSIEAEQLLTRGARAGTFKVFWSVIGEFLTHYVKFQGFRDGWRGFYYSAFMAHYYAAKWGKLRTLREVGDREAIRSRYQQTIDALLAGYRRGS